MVTARMTAHWWRTLMLSKSQITGQGRGDRCSISSRIHLCTASLSLPLLYMQKPNTDVRQFFCAGYPCVMNAWLMYQSELYAPVNASI